MNNFATTQGPFLSGMRPKTFFAARKQMMTEASKQGNGGLKYFAGWNRNKNVQPKENKQGDKSLKAFIESLPWTLALAQLLYIVIL